MRVTNTLLFNTALFNIQRQQERLFVTQEEATTGKKLRRPSDDVSDTRRVLSGRDTLAALQQFKRNRNTLTTLLQSTDSALGDTENILTRAKELAIQGANDTLSTENRVFIAKEVAQLFSQLVQTGNSDVSGRHLFAGRRTSQVPFAALIATETTPRGLAASGSLTVLGSGALTLNGVAIRPPQAGDDTLSTSDNAASAVALAAAINAAETTGVRAEASTSLSLTVTAFGNLSAGEFTINGQGVTGTITDAASLAAAVNAAGIPGVYAITSGANNLTLLAEDGRNLQLQTAGGVAGLNFTEFDLSGAALDRTVTGTVRLFAQSAFTIAGSNPGSVGLQAGEVTQIDGAQYFGDGQGVELGLGVGQTLPASTLGSGFLVAELGANIDAATPLAVLNRGQGVATGSITITDRAGQTATVNLATATTVGDILSAISGAAGVNVTATISAAGDGMVITDDNATPTQHLTIAEVGTGTTAHDLGLAAARPGDIVGLPLQPRLLSSTPLALLYNGQGLARGTIHVANGGAEADVDLSSAQTIGDVIAAINGSNTNVTARLNVTGTALEVRSNDPRTVAVVTDIHDGSTAAKLGIQGPNDTLKTLGLLTEALHRNDQPAITRLLQHIEAGADRVAALRADVGARLNRVELTERNHEELELTVTGLLSQAENADIVEVFTRLASLTTAFQATLAATARTVQPTLQAFLQ